MKPTMTAEAAIEIIDQLRKQFRGTPDEHEVISQAIQTLKDLTVIPPGGNLRD